MTKLINLFAGAAMAGLLAVAIIACPSYQAFAQDAAEEAAPADGVSAPQQVTVTFDELITMLTTEAEKDNPRAMLTLGNIWEGTVSPQNRNYGKALDWYKKAAALDLTEAFYRIGVCYEVGLGTAPDMSVALENYEKASSLGFPMADFKLAVLNLNGAEGVPQNVDQGMRYLNIAADSGLTVAIKELGALYYYGRLNITKNLTKALELFGKAADSGDAESMKNIGAMTISGEGTAADKVDGLKWYLLAQRFGYTVPEMQQTVDDIKSGMTTEEVAKAEAESEAWAKKFTDEQEAKNQAAAAAAAAAQEAAQQTKPASN